MLASYSSVLFIICRSTASAYLPVPYLPVLPSKFTAVDSPAH